MRPTSAGNGFGIRPLSAVSFYDTSGMTMLIVAVFVEDWFIDDGMSKPCVLGMLFPTQYLFCSASAC